VCLILLLLLAAGRATHLRLVHHINPIRVGGGKTTFGKIVEICLVLGMALWVGTVLIFAFHFEERFLPAFVSTSLFDTQSLRLAGAAMLICCLLIFISALIAFGNSWRVGIDEKTPGKLVSAGIFAITRNPIFLSLIVFAAGVFLING